MPVPYNGQTHPKIPSHKIIETILVQLIQRKNVLVYGRPGVGTSQLLRGIEAQSPAFSKEFSIDRLSQSIPIDLDDLDQQRATLVDDVSLPLFSQKVCRADTENRGTLVGLTAATSRPKALSHWHLFIPTSPDLIIEIAATGEFYDVTGEEAPDPTGEVS